MQKTHEFSLQENHVQDMQHLQERYHQEDELLTAVSHGNADRALEALKRISPTQFEPRNANMLRDSKNLMLTFNTLLRRTAYEAGVHPFYIDTFSRNYAILIEQSTNPDEIWDIAPYLIRSYCDLVEKRSMSSYSEPVRHILVTVDASLDGDLSLRRFANELFLNTSYLSTLFKKEIGMTLTDYVNQCRMDYAKKMLKSTTLSIQSIAIQSGIQDIHYFTRLFHRETGMSPREFRNQGEA